MTRAAIFKAVREARGRSFTPDEVPILDVVLDRLGVPKDEAPGLVVSSKGIDLIKSFEGYAKARADGGCEAYPDPGSGGDPWTIGFGSTGADIRKGTVWTRQQADDRFRAHVEEFAAGVRRLLGGAATTQGEFDALVSLAYNIGLGNLSTSSLLALHKAGDKGGACGQFQRWNRAAGRVMAGLTRRRAAEAELYAGRA